MNYLLLQLQLVTKIFIGQKWQKWILKITLIALLKVTQQHALGK